jgi:hypothetical protein
MLPAHDAELYSCSASPHRRYRNRCSNLLDRRYRPFFGNNATTSNCRGSSRNKTTAAVSLLPGLLRPDGRVEFAHNWAAIRIRAASTDNALIFLSGDNRSCCIRRDRRHGFVRLSPCFFPHWPRCRLKAATKVNNSSCCAFRYADRQFRKQREKTSDCKPRITAFTINRDQYGRGINLAAVRFLEQRPARTRRFRDQPK